MKTPTFEQALNEIVEETGAPRELLSKLRGEDDWSFVIKLHSLIEAIVSNMLTRVLDDDRLETIFSEMELSNKKTGKMAFVKHMRLMPSKHRRFIHCLSELRNVCVHKVSNISLDLRNYVKSLDNQQFASFVKCFALSFDKPEITVGEDSVKIEELVKGIPKIVIWLGALDVIKDLYIEKKKASLIKERRKRDQELSDRIAKESFLRLATTYSGSFGEVSGPNSR